MNALWRVLQSTITILFHGVVIYRQFRRKP